MPTAPKGRVYYREGAKATWSAASMGDLSLKEMMKK